MTYKVNDVVSIKIEVTVVGDSFTERGSVAADKWFEIPLQFGNSLNSFHMSAGSTSKLPILEFTITDELRFFDTFKQAITPGVTDGSLFKVTIIAKDEVVRYFRVYNWFRVPSGGTGFAYSFTCYWDSVKYWCKRASTPAKVSSSAMLQKIATDCKIDWWAQNDTTSDTMLWQPHNRFFGDWAKEIAAAGYKSDTSHMVLGVDSKGKMRYKDVNRDLSGEEPVIVSLTRPGDVVDDKHHLVQDFSTKVGAGLYNSIGGYSHARYVQAVTGPNEGLSLIDDDFDVDSAEVKDAKMMLRNLEVVKYIEASVISFSPIDFKQVGDNYEKGRWQNARYNLLNCVTGEFLFAYPTDWELTDYFVYRAPDQLSDNNYDGLYTVATKTILISGGNYYEKISALRTGLEPQGGT